MSALLLAVVTASLLGSLHCAGMCGPLSVALLPRGGRPAARVRVQAAWHGGRLAVYALLGALFGAVGAAVDLGFSVFALQGIAMRVAGGAIVLIGAVALLRRIGLRLPRLGGPGSAVVVAVTRRARGLPPNRRALLLGVGSALLPCGWLYAFALAAAGTGGAASGAALMVAFWAGTVPLLALAGEGAARLVRPAARRAPWLPDLAVVLVGLLLLAQRNALADVPGLDRGPTDRAAIRALDPADAPCCHEEPPGR